MSRALIIFAAVLPLSACGCGDIATTQTVATQASVTPAINEPTRAPAAEPASTEPVMCTDTITADCYIIACPQSTAAADTCPPSPYPLPAGRFPR